MMDRTPTSAYRQGVRPPTEPSARSVRLEALRSARVPDAQKPERGRPSHKLPDFGDRQRSKSRNYDIFLPKQSHLHTPRRQELCSNPDRITRSASPTRVLKRSESGAQNYRTSLSAVSTNSRDELNSTSSNTLDSSNDAISIHSDSPFRKRQVYNYMSLPHGRSGNSSNRFKAVDSKAGQILRDYHRDKDRVRLELYDITTGKQQCDFGANNDDDIRTPTAVNGHDSTDDVDHHGTFDSVTTPSTASSCGSPVSQDKLKTPNIQISDVNGNRGNGDIIMENDGGSQGGKPLITAEYYCVKRVNYDELKQKYGNGETQEKVEETDEAVKKLNLLSANGEKEKKSLASSISNFFRKMSPKLSRRSRDSEKSSNSSMADDDFTSQDSPSHRNNRSQDSPSHRNNRSQDSPSHRNNRSKPRGLKSPIASPIRRLINGKKHVQTDTKSENKNASDIRVKAPMEVVKKELDVAKSLPPRTLNVEDRAAVGGLDLKKRGLLSTRSTDSIGECSLDVSMTGSDPSLASGPQSCSVSKRTLQSTEPAKTFSNPDIGGTDSPIADAHKCSYLGLSVSVGGYPKYRNYKSPSQERVLYENETKAKSNDDAVVTDEDLVNANNAANLVAETDTQEAGQGKAETIPTPLLDNVANSNNSAGGDEEVFAKGNGEGKENFKTPEKPRLRVAINGKPTVFGDHGDGEICVTSPVDVTTRTKELSRGSVAKGGEFYLARVADETTRFRLIVSLAEPDLAQTGKTEEVYGKLRAAIGKANLLVSQKFKQFIGLCHDNMKAEGDLVTNEDLAGFWDMMSLQVEDVDAAFAEIEKMRENDWVEIQPPVLRTLSSSSQRGNTPDKPKPKRTPKKAANAAASKSRDEARKRLMEAKRLAMRKRLTSGGSIDDVEIFIAEPDSKPSA